MAIILSSRWQARSPTPEASLNRAFIALNWNKIGANQDNAEFQPIPHRFKLGLRSRNLQRQNLATLNTCIASSLSTRWQARSPILSEADLFRLLSELLALHHDAVLADQGVPSVATRHARAAVALRSWQASNRLTEGVADLALLLGTSEQLVAFRS